MNPVYAILEAPYKWTILAGMAAGSGFLGAIMIITYGWAHWFARIWFFVGLALALYCIIRLTIEWRDQLAEGAGSPASNTGSD